MRHTITIQPANIEFTAASTETILAAALSADIDLPYGCQGGACGTCMVSKASGDIHYPSETPPALDQDDIDNGKILCCQAFACSDLVLEVPSIGNNKQTILTLPTRVKEKSINKDNCLCLTVKLPGEQPFPDYETGQQIEILAGAGKVCLAKRGSETSSQCLQLIIAINPTDNYINFLANELKIGEMLRIRGPV